MSSKPLQNKQLEQQIAWLRQQSSHSKLSTQQLQQQNRKVLLVLKNLQGRLDKQLEQQKYSRISLSSQENQADPLKVVVEHIKNNENILRVLEREVKKLRERREQLKEGLQSRLNSKKYDLQKRISELKTELRRLKLEQNEINKKLSTRQNPIQPQFLSQHGRLQEQLRVFSIKYMKIVDKYNKVTEQLANTSDPSPDLHIPEEIYDKELQQREEAQFKEYQGIVKMCTILSKRNDSQTNKYNRMYTQKLKELEKIIVNLGQIDRMIALKEGEILEGKKNLELVKYRSGNNNGDRLDEFMSVSQSQLRRISYSTSRLPLQNKQPIGKEYSQGHKPPRKLSKMV